MIEKYVRIVLVLGMIAVMCGTASAGMGIVAETQVTSSGSYPACSSPCECISESAAAIRWGTEGYDRCSKTVCGQSADAMTQYYCFHSIGGTSSPSYTTCQAPCECLSDSSAIAKWGTGGYSQCTKTSCGMESTTGGSVPRYCYRQWGSTLVIGGSGTAAATTVPATATLATVLPVQTQVQTLVQTQVQAPVATVTESPVHTVTWPAADAVPQQRTPVSTVTIIAAIGAALVAAVMIRKE